jgi:hypothetical protein
MAKVTVEQCDLPICKETALPVDGGSIPYGWVAVRFQQEGIRTYVHKVYCSVEHAAAGTALALWDDDA